MKLKKVIRKTLVIFILLQVLLLAIKFLRSEEVIKYLESVKIIENIVIIVNVFLLSLFVSLLNNIHLLILYFGIKIGYKYYEKQKLSKNDFNKYKDYYRDILIGFNPLVLSFIDNLKITNFAINAELLYLQKNKYIKDDGELSVIKKDDKLSLSEKYLLDNIESGSLNKISLFDLENLVSKDAKNKDLIKIKEKSKKSKTFLNIICFIIYYFVLFYSHKYVLNIFNLVGEDKIFIFIILYIIIYGTLFLVPHIFIISKFTYWFKFMKNPYVRTEKGEDINIKLEGLKNYIKDFSILPERKKEELTVWGEYLIYATLFGYNNNVVNYYDKITD